MLQGRQHNVAADAVPIDQAHDSTDGIQQRAGGPTAQHLFPETASRQHWSLQQLPDADATLEIEQLHPRS